MNVNNRQRPDARVPRYTSYPTAPHFHDGVTASAYAGWLKNIGPNDETSLYLHIPYCHEMCWYCGCHTKIASRYQPIASYVKTLRAEIALIAKSLKTKPPVTHVHWGGGTPTILTADDFLAVMDDLRSIFAVTDEAEIAVEIDPRTLTKDMIDGLQTAGITRASLGVQDCNPHVQAAINRIQPFEQTASVVEALRRVGIKKINLDLMYGLPFQTVEDVHRTVDLAVSLEPDRLAVFGYAHVPWMKSHQKMIDETALPNGEERLRQATEIAADLKARGYLQIGLDHFARDDDPLAAALTSGRLRRNFQGYTTDQTTTLLGFGASSIGTLREGYVQNNPDIKKYSRSVTDGILPTIRGLELSRDDRIRRSVIERLMCDMKVDLKTVCARTNIDETYFADELAALKPYCDDGLIGIEGDTISITDAGQPWMRVICSVFDKYLQSDRIRHSAAI